MDFSGILDGLSATTATTAIIGAAALIALVGFASWAAKKVAGFFGRWSTWGRCTAPFLFQGHCMDFSIIIAGLDVTGPVACFLAAGALVAAGSFVQWLAPKVARFFVMRGR